MKKTYHISRRNFLALSAGTGLSLSLGGCGILGSNRNTATNVISSQPLPIPKLLTGKEINGQRVYDLTMQQGSMVFVPGKITSTFGYNGNILGPTMLMKKGDDVVINVTNKLGEPSTTHWHGLHLPAIMDGGPHQRIENGDTWQARFRIMNEAATFWYHPHLMGKTAEHVYHGLAGLFIVKDPQSNLALPDQYGIDDIPLIIQDKIFNADGSINYPGTKMGVKGDHFLVNGAITPIFNAPAQFVRFRILNGSNARIYNFGFSDNREFHQIGTDGGLLEKPVPLTRLILSTGERAEILVDFSGQENSKVQLVSYSSEIGKINNIFVRDAHDKSTIEILTINVNSSTTNPIVTLPASLAIINRIKESQAVKTRDFKLQMPFGNFLINGKKMDLDRIDQTINLNDIEIWKIKNSSDMAHPFHVHDIQFLILTRNGESPPENERGWKDVVLVKKHETVRFITRFGDYSDPDTPYMFHCHILEHEDAGMMGQFVVVTI